MQKASFNNIKGDKLITKAEILNRRDETTFWMRCSTDPVIFIRDVVGPSICTKNGVNVFGRDLDTFQEDMIKLAVNPKYPYLNITSFRGSLKTSIFSIGLPLYFMCFHSNKFKKICITSSSMDTQSREILDILKQTISNNEFLQFLAPKNPDLSWNSQEINTSMGTKYRILPFNDSARSWSADLMILDDILRAKDISQEEIKNIFWHVFYPIAVKNNGLLWVVCTPQSATDLLVELDENKGFLRKKYPIVQTDVSGNWTEPTWKKRHILKHTGEQGYGCQCLECIEKRMGDYAWSKEYLCLPFSSQDKLFPYSIIQPNLIDESLEKGFKDRQYFSGMDVAMSKSSTADYSAISILERGKDNILRQRKIYRFKGWTQNQQINELKRLHQLFNFTKILVEERGLSIGMVQDMKDQKLHPELAYVTEGFITNQDNKEAIITRFATALQNNSIKILNNKQFLEELSGFGCVQKKDRFGNTKTTFQGVGVHDDMAMAAFISLEAANMLSSSGSIGTIDW